MNIMIVDDNASIRAMIRSILEQMTDTFCECSDGSEAVESYASFHPDWVLMDIKMNRMDGYQAMEAIRSTFPEAKVIMITQYNDPELKERARRAGAVDFVLKEHLLDIEQIIRSHCN
jgi:CheY-like chemotaxis protein